MIDIKNIISFIKDELRTLDPDLKSTEWYWPDNVEIHWEGQIECESWRRDGINYQSVKIHTDKCTVFFDGDLLGEIELLGKYLQELNWTDQTH